MLARTGFSRMGLYFRTARHIPLTQLAYFVLRRWLSPVSQRGDQHQECRVQPVALRVAGTLPTPEPCVVNGSFRFLAQAADFTVRDIDWRAGRFPKLWRYHLHFFDWLRNPDLHEVDKAATISSWIRHNPAGSEDAWEPYTTSLRLINWIRFFSGRMQAGESLQPEWLESLRMQGEWLHRNVEYHIRANHLLKNLLAMTWFCLFLQNDPRYRRWLKQYCSRLVRQLREQFNVDGGHYEGSPGYHALCLELCIDLYGVLQETQAAGILADRLRSLIPAALEFQRALSFRDGRIALFGDSTLHGAHDWKTLQSRWTRLGGMPLSVPMDTLMDCRESGFVSFETLSYRIIISTRGVSPSYQPGHAHCDMGSFELELPHGRLLVDSGVSQYAAGEMRNYVRSSRAHNVVMVNGQNQHEMWGEFRVGARGAVMVSGPRLVRDSDAACVEVVLRIASHTAMKLPWRQTRIFRLYPAAVEVLDEVELAGFTNAEFQMESGLHLHPAVAALSGENGLHLQINGRPAARLQISGASEVASEPAHYCPDFGVVHNNIRLCARRAGRGRLTLTARLELRDEGAV